MQTFAPLKKFYRYLSALRVWVLVIFVHIKGKCLGILTDNLLPSAPPPNIIIISILLYFVSGESHQPVSQAPARINPSCPIHAHGHHHHHHKVVIEPNSKGSIAKPISLDSDDENDTINVDEDNEDDIVVIEKHSTPSSAHNKTGQPAAIENGVAAKQTDATPVMPTRWGSAVLSGQPTNKKTASSGPTANEKDATSGQTANQKAVSSRQPANQKAASSGQPANQSGATVFPVTKKPTG